MKLALGLTGEEPVIYVGMPRNFQQLWHRLGDFVMSRRVAGLRVLQTLPLLCRPEVRSHITEAFARELNADQHLLLKGDLLVLNQPFEQEVWDSVGGNLARIFNPTGYVWEPVLELNDLEPWHGHDDDPSTYFRDGVSKFQAFRAEMERREIDPWLLLHGWTLFRMMPYPGRQQFLQTLAARGGGSYTGQFDTTILTELMIQAATDAWLKNPSSGETHASFAVTTRRTKPGDPKPGGAKSADPHPEAPADGGRGRRYRGRGRGLPTGKEPDRSGSKGPKEGPGPQ